MDARHFTGIAALSGEWNETRLGVCLALTHGRRNLCDYSHWIWSRPSPALWTRTQRDGPGHRNHAGHYCHRLARGQNSLLAVGTFSPSPLGNGKTLSESDRLNRAGQDRQLDHKCRAFPQAFAACVNRAPVHLDGRFANGQTEAKPFAARINLLEGFENLLDRLRGDAHAAVADLDDERVRSRIIRTRGNRAAFRREFAGVAKHVPENLLQARRIDMDLMARGIEKQRKFEMSIFDFAADNFQRVPKQFVRIGGAKLKL